MFRLEKLFTIFARHRKTKSEKKNTKISENHTFRFISEHYTTPAPYFLANHLYQYQRERLKIQLMNN